MSGAFKSREEHKRAIELEEARKSGLAPAELDEDGNEINPHIPQFMAAAPWYLSQNNAKAGLKHQKAFGGNDKEGGDEWYQRGAKTFQATKFRKGACENCGAMTHKRKECTERPRTVGAVRSNKNIAGDELVQSVELNWDGKRDRYNGFDSSDYSRVVDRFERAEQLKQEVAKKKELERAYRKAHRGGGDVPDEKSDDDDDSDDDDGGEAKLEDSQAQGFMKVTKRVRTAGGGASMTVRNLRIREDTAKYLRNLDLSSAYYDPKTRSMRENPTPHSDPAEQFFIGDNAKRKTGDTLGFERLNGHAFDAYQKGQEIHMQAAPSQAELLYKQYKDKKEKLTGQTKNSILEKYGNAAAHDPAPEGLLLGQTENYMEYDRAGRIIKGAEKMIAKSRYEEDVHTQNHKAVWGSFWQSGQWGYACCRSCQKNSYCTGIRGIEAAAGSADQMKENLAAREAAMAAQKKQEEEELVAAAEAAAAAGASKSKKPAAAKATNPFEQKKDLWGEEVAEDLTLDPSKLMDALRKEDKRLKEGGSGGGEGGEDQDRKRGYNVNHEVEVSEEEMEAYRMKKARKEDPMASGDAGTKGYDMV
mmetsp:Transcript_15673/g.38031  ORF Transcript_15673/g.38031 Transcript_15673/m.38031 type:complete len:587 (+) Transcript_15673:211-1971(+)|eukprot:CAMPEP_0197581686 /NCGR_PEP_ID=MMETSP1326-20131121/5118_1 /TAXON_ID=1155430 /ORGANISM="Genus nov. species nov., Strain RCC2288" /LENGTH=586 /DNA_ID=CAMNT_0043145631 /DNA_START=195 /DNA_END=1955 /DNA_ORIENTATION=+